ncbi:MAG: hypothetical protein ACRD9R_13345 [Pyrinomonadaceae bacterium]
MKHLTVSPFIPAVILWLGLIVVVIITTQCAQRQPDEYAPVSNTAKVSDEGELFGSGEGNVPFADSPASVSLWMTARGIRDMPAIEAMITSGRVVFLPVGAYVDVLAHDEKEFATKVRVRGGKYIGRELWTHPKFVTSINNL